MTELTRDERVALCRELYRMHKRMQDIKQLIRRSDSNAWNMSDLTLDSQSKGFYSGDVCGRLDIAEYATMAAYVGMEINWGLKVDLEEEFAKDDAKD